MHLNRHALKAFREIRGLTRVELAELANSSQPHISNIEVGRKVASPELIHRFASALGVDVRALVLIEQREEVAA